MSNQVFYIEDSQDAYADLGGGASSDDDDIQVVSVTGARAAPVPRPAMQQQPPHGPISLTIPDSPPLVPTPAPRAPRAPSVPALVPAPANVESVDLCTPSPPPEPRPPSPPRAPLPPRPAEPHRMNLASSSVSPPPPPQPKRISLLNSQSQSNDAAIVISDDDDDDVEEAMEVDEQQQQQQSFPSQTPPVLPLTHHSTASPAGMAYPPHPQAGAWYGPPPPQAQYPYGHPQYYAHQPPPPPPGMTPGYAAYPAGPAPPPPQAGYYYYPQQPAHPGAMPAPAPGWPYPGQQQPAAQYPYQLPYQQPMPMAYASGPPPPMPMASPLITGGAAIRQEPTPQPSQTSQPTLSQHTPPALRAAQSQLAPQQQQQPYASPAPPRPTSKRLSGSASQFQSQAQLQQAMTAKPPSIAPSPSLPAHKPVPPPMRAPSPAKQPKKLAAPPQLQPQQQRQPAALAPPPPQRQPPALAPQAQRQTAALAPQSQRQPAALAPQPQPELQKERKAAETERKRKEREEAKALESERKKQKKQIDSETRKLFTQANKEVSTKEGASELTAFLHSSLASRLVPFDEVTATIRETGAKVTITNDGVPMYGLVWQRTTWRVFDPTHKYWQPTREPIVTVEPNVMLLFNGDDLGELVIENPRGAVPHMLAEYRRTAKCIVLVENLDAWLKERRHKEHKSNRVAINNSNPTNPHYHGATEIPDALGWQRVPDLINDWVLAYGIKVLHTHSRKETLEYLARFTCEVGRRPYHIRPPAETDQETVCVDVTSKKGKTPTESFRNGLAEIKGITEATAGKIVGVYPTVMSLYAAYEADPAGAPLLLTRIDKVGRASSEKVYRAFMSRDPKARIN
ncbi:hypothetical protein H9P43_001087 [Blastocladiella emersonii ATCC 22665]|nr:hypothetical protein H9P43_001087 [Blastocladiella emersonii ATCC 22665]